MRAQCCICSDLFESSLSVNIAAAPCGHTFHEICLMRWMDTSSTCPSCRTHVKKNQIIKRLFFDISEDVIEDEDVDSLVNQVGNLKAQLREKDKEKQELAESRDGFAARLAVCESEKEELSATLNKERNVKDVMLRDLKHLQRENAAYVEEMKEFRKTERKLQELRNVETVLKGCDSDVQEIVNQYSDGGDSSIKQLGSLLTVMKREYNQVLSDKKMLREQVSKLKKIVGHSKSEARQSNIQVEELKTELEKTNENLNKILKENNGNRRKLVHLRNALRHDKTEGSQSFHQALNEDSPNVAFTPPKLKSQPVSQEQEDQENLDSSPFKNSCMTPDLFDDTPPGPRRHKLSDDGNENGPKFKFVKIPTAEEKLKAAKRARLEMEDKDNCPKVPQSMMSIMHKKLTGQSNSRTHVPSVITRGYDGFGGSTTFVQPTGPPKSALMKFAPKKKTVVKKSKLLASQTLTNQPRLGSLQRWKNCPSSTSSSSELLSLSVNSKDEKRQTDNLRHSSKKSTKSSCVIENPPFTKLSSSSILDTPKLTSNLSGFIDLT